jgi:DNA-binding FadR family transcriptional regulator
VGTEVLDPLASMSPEVLQVMLAQPSGAIDLHVLESFLEIRAVLDEQMSALAAERRSRADLTALRAIIRDLRAFADPPKAGGASSFAADPARFYARVKDVGFVLARATKNPIYLMLAHWNLAVVARLEHVFGAVRPAPDAHADGLDALARAVEDKDAKTARDLVRSFHAWANPRILATAAMSSGAPLSDLKKVLR